MPTQPPTEGLWHTIHDGEWVGAIADQYGYSDWEKQVWKNRKNAGLRSKRPDPRVLAIGDKLFIPPWEEKKENAPHEKTSKFKLGGPKTLLRLKLLDPVNKPLKYMPYELTVNAPGTSVPFKQAAQKTDEDGGIEETVPISTQSVELLLVDLGQKVELKVGGLSPLAPNEKEVKTRAAQERLCALGFGPVPVDGNWGPVTSAAIRDFQKFCKDHKDDGDPTITGAGEIDGELTDKTLDALKKRYGA